MSQARTLSAELADTVQRAPAATVRPAPPRTKSAREQAMAVLAGLSRGRERIQLKGVIGEGGMGVVRTASQVALGRTVAVKSLPPAADGSADALALLREAWITGSLEHPNVVPVHDIGIDDQGNPMIVLKRIDGVSWSQLINDASAVRERFAATDLLVWNLEILLQVCNAVRFAHSRGILHRDLKPENVMIGEFGEVYVLDWGLAVSLKPDERGFLPLARDAIEMAGTPCYMAPEMLGAGDVPLSERTDVYLLGGLLYEIVVGLPPHRGETSLEMLRSVVLSQPSFPDDAPEELADLCRKAMSAEPEDRPESADAIRVAIQDFIHYRGSATLADRAEADLASLQSSLADDTDKRDPALRRQELYRLFGASRFGFQAALEAWPDNHAASQGLQRSLTAMAEYELAMSHPEAAAALLAELAEPPAELQRHIQAAVRNTERQEQRMLQLEQMSAELDKTRAAGPRDVMMGMVALFFAILPAVVEWTVGLQAITYPVVISITLGFVGLFGVLFLVIRRSFTTTAINRRVLSTISFLVLAQVASELGFWLLGESAHYSLVFLLLLWAFAAAVMIGVVEVEAWLMTVGFLGAFLLAAWRIDWVLYCMSGANLVVLVNIALVRANRQQPANNDQDDQPPHTTQE